MFQLLTRILSVSVDCPALISLAAGMGIDTKDIVRFTEFTTDDCCKTYDMQIANGIACRNGRVSLILWGQNNYGGYINQTALNLLSNIEVLSLEGNSLSGVVPSFYPDSIVHMNLGANGLPGTILRVPSGIEYLHLDHDRVLGDVPAFPDTLQNLRIDGGNLFTGAVHLQSPIMFMAANTFISRVYIEDISQLSLSACQDCYGFCEISNTLVYQTQVDYLSNVCYMSGIVSNTECGVVKDIALDLHIDKLNITAFDSLIGTCCEGAGITCDSNSHIIEINWSGMSLNGTLDTSKIELLYSYLESFNISNNQIIGGFLNGFTSNIVSLDLSSNKLSEIVGNIRLNKLRVLNLANNEFKGNLFDIPQHLISLNISNNAFDGLPLSIPANVTLVDVSYNNITGSINLNAPSFVNIKNNKIQYLTFVTNTSLVYCNIQGNMLINPDYPTICIRDEKISYFQTFNSDVYILAYSTVTTVGTKTERSLKRSKIRTVTSALNTFAGSTTLFNFSVWYLFRMALHFMISLLIATKLFHFLWRRKKPRKARKTSFSKMSII